ncbi:MAG TPA: endopeptidase La [Anaerolineae bacterium]|nr:endopeptidase La [Anaerolineae bacterium]
MINFLHGQLVSSDGSNKDETEHIPAELPILPLRNTVIFPSTVLPISVGRDFSRKLIDDIVPGERTLGCMFQKNPEIDNPAMDDLYPVGTVCRILKVIQLPTGEKSVVLQGLHRFMIGEIITDKPYLKVKIKIVLDEGEFDLSTEALINNIRQNAIKMVNIVPNIPDEVAIILQNIEEPRVLLDMISANLSVSVEEKVKILTETNIKKRCEKVNKILTREVEMMELSKKINDQVRNTIDKSQRDYFLREQMKAIQKELGEIDEHSREIEELREKIASSGMPEDIKKTEEEELNRLSRMNPASPEYPMLRNHMDIMLDLPWSIFTEDSLDIVKAQTILDEDHYDLKTVKERILEYLSVRKLNRDIKGPILCFIGPPGVGKTSLGQSIARAMGRKFVRMSLGGIHDEAEIRGHRRTYIGSLPGRIIQGIKKAGSQNPLFMLDEIDKLGADFRGDPTSALLEVLDPQQNNTFEDNYLGVPFDLSKVMFICTGNEISSIPSPLLDRMEVLRLPGYTEEEKIHIAKKYLVPRQIIENGLEKSQIRFYDGALRTVISLYTREAGVRNLEREIANICRGVAKKLAMGETVSFTIKKSTVQEYLGPPAFFKETVERVKVPGVAVGLAWTPVGGTILFIEVSKMNGDGKLLLTGKLGDMMKESAQAALSYIRSKSKEFNINHDFLKNLDLHIHIPAGAIPKDGPSAGVALFSAILSILKEKHLPNDVAMTGEITLRGIVLPVGGIKEKLVGAWNAGIQTVLIPRKNEKDLLDVPDEVKKRMKIVFINTLDDVVEYLFPETKV